MQVLTFLERWNSAICSKWNPSDFNGDNGRHDSRDKHNVGANNRRNSVHNNRVSRSPHNRRVGRTPRKLAEDNIPHNSREEVVLAVGPVGRVSVVGRNLLVEQAEKHLLKIQSGR